MAAAANATTIRIIGTRLGRQELMLGVHGVPLTTRQPSAGVSLGVHLPKWEVRPKPVDGYLTDRRLS
jgi:hypothetical protein